MEFVPLVLLVAFIFLGAPILAIIALTKVGRLERQRGLSLPAGMEARLARLEKRVDQLSQTLGQGREAVSAPQPPAEARPPVETPRETPTPPTRVEAKTEPRAKLDLETLIAGRWLNRIGVIALLLAVGFFLKYTFDNDWVGPRGRIALGLFSGTGLLVYSQWLLRRSYRYFSGGIAGLAAGVLYLSLYAAWSFYQLIPQPVAFAGMIVVTGTMIALALGRDSQPLATLALVGGLLTPVLLSTGKDAQVQLFTYLALLNASVLVFARLRNWRWLELVAFFGTIIYYWTWIESFYLPRQLWRTTLFATLFFVEFAALPILQSKRVGEIAQHHVGLVLMNATAFLVALHHLLYDDHRWALTWGVLILAVAHLGAARLFPTPKPSQRSVARMIFAGLALTFVTLAIPIRLEGKWITIAWAVEGAVLVWSGFEVNLRALRWAGLSLLGVTAFRLWFFEVPAHRFLLNPRFLTFAVAVACFAVAFLVSRRHPQVLSQNERRAFDLVGLAVNVFALWVLSLEVWEVFGRMHLGADTRLTQQLALSLLWTVYATALMLWGVRGGNAALRWQGLTLLGLVVGKVFLYDLSFLERFYRIISFVVLGVVLLVVSFFYQQKLAAGRSGEEG
jgi:uncharacterized membrane protein